MKEIESFFLLRLFYEYSIIVEISMTLAVSLDKIELSRALAQNFAFSFSRVAFSGWITAVILFVFLSKVLIMQSRFDRINVQEKEKANSRRFPSKVA